jgi:drug/metabolite transporter (DMT)-like permease
VTAAPSRLVLSIALVIAILAVSTSSIFIRFAQGDGVPSIVIAALRLTFASLLLAPIALYRHLDEIKRFTRTELLLGALSGIFLAIHFATWITSLEFTTVASSVVFVGTGPLWVALVSPFLLNERLDRIATLGLAISLAGGVIVGLADACTWDTGLSCPDLANIMQGRAMWGNFLALAGAWAVTGYLIIGRKARGDMSLVPYIFMVYGMAALTLLLFMLVSGHTPFGYAPKTYGWIVLLAAVPQLIGHSTFNWSLKFLPASFVAITTLGEPISSATLAYFVLKEIPSPGTVLGAVLILSGIAIVSRTGKHDQENP